MTREIQLRFDYEALDGETRAFVLERAERIHNLARMTAAALVQIGQYLTEVKARLKHGQFLEWIEREFGWQRTSADRFMNVFERVKLPKLGNLEIDVSALYLIAAPSTPEPARTEVMRRAANGEPVTHAGARALVERFAETGELPEVDKTLPQIIAERRTFIERADKPSPEEIREMRELNERRRVNSLQAQAFMAVVHAIETLSSPALTMEAAARELDRYDTPDKNWRGRTGIAAKTLAELIQELKK